MERWGLHSEKRTKTVFKDSVCNAKQIDAKLRLLYEKRDVSCIQWCKVVSADVAESDVCGEIDVLGRPLTKKIADFIAKPLPLILGRRKRSQIKYISGLPGCGKTYSVLDAVGYLHVRNLKAVQALKKVAEEVKDSAADGDTKKPADDMKIADEVKGVGDKLQTISDEVKGVAHVQKVADEEAADEVKDLKEAASFRIAYLAGHNFVADPMESLYRALIMAFINDAEVLKDLCDLDYDTDTDAEVRAFLSRTYRNCGLKVCIVLDDGNALDRKKKLTANENEKRSTAFLVLQSIVGTARVVVCASIKSKLRKVLTKGVDIEYMFVREGFSDLELSAYLSFYGKQKKDIETSKTGSIPRLLWYYLQSQGQGQILDVLGDLEKALDHYLKKAKESSLMKVIVAATGGRMEEFSEVLDTGCFIRSSKGNAFCLTERLRARAIGRAGQYVTRIQTNRVPVQIERLTQQVLSQNTTAAIGWTAEAAAIISLRLRQPEIELDNDVDMKITPQAVTVFRGELTKAKMKGGEAKATLYIPLVFNHMGADIYYQDLRFLVVGHITVGSKPAQNHPGTYLVAERLFAEDSRIKVILWVVVQTEEDPLVTRPSGTKDYYEVFIPFGKLDSALSLIDEKVKELRCKKVCRSCGIEDDAGTQVECSECGSWYHVRCTDYAGAGDWSCSDCKHASGDLTADDER